MNLEQYQILERTKALYGHMTTVLLGTLTIVSLTTFVLWPVVNQFHLMIWFCAMLTLLLFRTFSVRRYSKAVVTENNAQDWVNKVVFWSSLSGTGWGMVLVFFMVPDQLLYIVFVVGVYCGFVSSSVSSMAIHFPSYLAFTIPATLLFCVSCIAYGYNGYGIVFYLTGLVIIIFWSVMTSFARNTRNSFSRTTRLTFENNQLISEVVEQKETAESAVLAKDQFLAAASHDLRQPLHALGLFTSALKDMNLDQEAKEVTENIEQSTDALNKLLNGLLDISRLDASSVEYRPQHILFKPLLEKVVSEYITVAEDKGSKIKLNVDDDLLIFSDDFLLERVVRNLIDNAVKFTSDGSINITSSLIKQKKAPDNIKLVVSDTGIGVPEDQQKNIFAEFTQLHNPERDRQKGLGLGLAIVWRLCELMGLPLDMKSEVGVGTEFTVSIPAGDLQLFSDITQTKRINIPGQIVNEDGLITFRDKVILVIDDEIDILKATERLLKSWEINPVVANSPEQAIVLLNEKELLPDMIIADFRLRDNLNGIEAISQVSEEFNQDIKAILVTGDTSPDRLKLAQSASLPILHKPVSPKALNAIIDTLLSSD